MLIRKLQLMDVCGLKGVHEYELEKLNVLCGKNGAGKSSFINALLYGLTGEKPDGKMITDGKAKAATCITLDTGGRYSRTEKVGKPAVYGLGDKKVIRSAFENAFTEETGIPIKALRITTSSEVIANMQPQEFGDFLLSYTGESLTADDIINYFGDMSAETEEKLRKVLPSGEFGVKTLDKAYEALTEERRTVKRTLTEQAAILKDRSAKPAPDESYEELVKEAEKLQESVKVLSAYKAEKAAFDKALSERTKQEKLLAETEKKLSDISVNESIDISERPALISKRDGINKKILSLTSVMAKTDSTISLIEKGLTDLSSSTCPLSDKLVCKTDKTPVRETLKESLNEAKASKTAQEKMFEELQKELKKVNEAIEQLDAEVLKRNEAKNLKEQVENIKKTLVEVPEKEPKVPAITDAEEQLKAVSEKLKAAEDAKKADEIAKSYNETTDVWQMLDTLAKALEPKGRIRSAITESYLQAFEDLCNKIAAGLRPEISVRFLSDRGVHVLADMTGKGVYLEYPSLSGGEKMYLMYILMSMLNSLTGSRLIILDELSVLDAESFDILLKLLAADSEGAYDQAFITVVDHNDTLESLKVNGITPLVL